MCIVIHTPVMSDTKTEQLSLRMSPKAKALLRVAATKEHRSVSNMVEHLVLAYCEQHRIALDDEPSYNKLSSK